jgi:hypothetical protein
MAGWDHEKAASMVGPTTSACERDPQFAVSHDRILIVKHNGRRADV